VSAELTRVDVADLDLATAGDAGGHRQRRTRRRAAPHHTAETFLLQCRDRNGEGPDAGFWLAHEGGRLVGYAALTLNLFENLDGAKIVGAVHPDHRRRGLGQALMEAAEEATDRPRLRAPAWADTAGERAVPHLVTPGRARTRCAASTSARRRGRSWSRSPSRRAGTTSWSGSSDPARTTLLGDLQVLREAINDEPGGGEFEVYSPERIRGYEDTLARQHQTAYTIVARHRSTGDPAGITMLLRPRAPPRDRRTGGHVRPGTRTAAIGSA
jgi:GNAT superfamily N-acetyltransferase